MDHKKYKEKKGSKWTVYPALELANLIDKAYAVYCEKISASDRLARPVSKSAWILSLVRKQIYVTGDACFDSAN